ncbi:MAG: hypothetical protein IJO20_02220 [Ruminococcus sp.]|nr:hypothetical protein [Ruminococcus sp.]MBQ7133290.1 hypothetical protein [Ruminococcus sp.]
MDYIKWSQEYTDEAKKILRIIENKKKMLKNVTRDERHSLNAEIINLRNIYYECMLTAKHLYERAGEMLDAA